jgi:hypothetical protein
MLFVYYDLGIFATNAVAFGCVLKTDRLFSNHHAYRNGPPMLIVDRKNKLKTRLLGLVFFLASGYCGTALLLHSDGGVGASVLGYLLIFISTIVLVSSLKFKDRLEFDGQSVRARRLWLRTWEAFDLQQLVEATLRFSRGAAGAPPQPGSALLRFGAGRVLFISDDFLPQALPIVAAGCRTRDTGLNFPLKLGRAQLMAFIHFVDDPRLGYSAGYFIDRQPMPVNVTLYIYDNGRKDIPEGSDSSDAVEEFDRACAELEQISRLGRSFGEIKSESRTMLNHATAGDIRVASYEFEHSGKRLLSRLYLTGWHGRFFKIRSTAEIDAASLDAEIDALLADLAAEWKTPAKKS